MQQSICLRFPFRHFIKELPRHMLANVVSALLLRARRDSPYWGLCLWIDYRLMRVWIDCWNAIVVTDHHTLNNVPVLDNRRIGTGSKLDSRIGHEWEDDIRRLGPRELLLLGYLHGHIHGPLGLVLPFAA